MHLTKKQKKGIIEFGIEKYGKTVGKHKASHVIDLLKSHPSEINNVWWCRFISFIKIMIALIIIFSIIGFVASVW